MKLLLMLLILSLSLTVKAQPNGEPYALYGCFHNYQAYAATMDAQTCPSLPAHTHVKNSYHFHYATTGTTALMSNQSITLIPFAVAPPLPTNQRGNPDCILTKTPLVE